MGKYRIGEFAELTGLSVRTLRFYDEKNVLKPEIVDYYSGYRYYSEEQIEEARYINILKDIEFSLDEIAMFRNNLTSDVLAQKRDELVARIEDYKRKIIMLDVVSEEVEKGNTQFYDMELVKGDNIVLKRAA